MISEYFAAHASQIIIGLIVFIVSLLVSSIACIFVLLHLPDHYFHEDAVDFFPADRPRWQSILRTAIKNLIGVGLVVLGLVMSLPGVPGQGLLTMFVGIVLLDLPGKRKLERRVISRPSILLACNRLRIRFGKNPFTLVPTLPMVNAEGETQQ